MRSQSVRAVRRMTFSESLLRRKQHGVPSTLRSRSNPFRRRRTVHNTLHLAKHWGPIILIGTVLSLLLFGAFGLFLFGLNYSLGYAPRPIPGLIFLLLTFQVVTWVEETFRTAQREAEDAVLREKVVILIDYLREKVAKLAREG